MSEVLHASGLGWVGAGVRSIETGIHELFAEARRRVVISAYSISSGAFDLPVTWIADAAARNVCVLLVVNRCEELHPSVLPPIRSIAENTGNVELWDYSDPDDKKDLHAKAVIVDDRRGLIGSSNLSGNGLLRNHELAVMIEGDAARIASNLIIELTRSTHASRWF
jgi:phosphatidylserine/phosphatidylglycerophosphate/cardiolipin synthase-like enzyme